MGQEARAKLHRGNRRIEGHALLEGDHVLFRGADVREKVLLSKVTLAECVDDALHLEHGDGSLRLSLAPGIAARWVAKIRNPKSRLDKLGAKEGMTVAVIDIDDPQFREELEAKGATVARRVPPRCPLIFFGAESRGALDRLAELRRQLAPDGAIWVVHRKGKEATLRDVDVFAAAKAVGLVDNKVASFSATHTAERLVIPLKDRGR